MFIDFEDKEFDHSITYCGNKSPYPSWNKNFNHACNRPNGHSGPHACADRDSLMGFAVWDDDRTTDGGD